MIEKIKSLLKQTIKIEEFDGRDVLFLPKEPFLELWQLREQEIEELIKEGHTKEFAKKLALRDYFKILNPKPHPVKVTSFSYRRTYSAVSNKELILDKYIEKDFYMWANHLRKEAKKFIEVYVFDEKEVKKIMDEVEEKIKEKEKVLKEILNNPNKFELLRTDYQVRKERDTLYQPVINARVFNLDTNSLEDRVYNLYLRVKVPNIIWEYTKPIPKKPRPSPLIEGIKEYENIFGRIYIKKRDD